MKKFEFYMPQEIEEALELLDLFKGDAKVISGGTDLIIELQNGFTPKKIVDISHIEKLSYITETDNYLKIGSTTNHNTLEKSKEINKNAYALGRACSEIGTWQISYDNTEIQ